MRRSEGMRMVAAHGCLVAPDRRAMTTAARSRRRKPQLALVAGQPVFIHRRKHGAQGWCGPGVCNRTHVRPATNEEAEGIETVASLLLGLTKVVREDARDTSMTSRTRGSWGRRGDGRGKRRHGRSELNVSANPDASSRSARSEPRRGARVRGRAFNRHGHGDWSQWSQGSISRQVEYGEHFRSAEASSSELPQASAAGAGDTPTGERLYISMTEEGPSGDHRPTRTMDPDERRKNDDH